MGKMNEKFLEEQENDLRMELEYLDYLWDKGLIGELEDHLIEKEKMNKVIVVEDDGELE